MVKLIILGALFAGLGSVHFGDRFLPGEQRAGGIGPCAATGCSPVLGGNASVDHMFVALGGH